MQRHSRCCLSLLGCLLVLLSLSGCGAKKVKVQGKLTYGSQPVTGAEKQPLVVTFCPFNGEGNPDGPPTAAEVNQETGAFEAVVPVGKHRICISRFQDDLSDQFNGTFAQGQSPIIRDIGEGGDVNLDLSQFKSQMVNASGNVPMPGAP